MILRLPDPFRWRIKMINLEAGETLAQWLYFAQQAGFRFIVLPAFRKSPPPTGWNREPYPAFLSIDAAVNCINRGINIGVCPVEPGAILVDVDSEEALMAIGGEDQGTLSCKTPRGWQFLFSGNDGLTQTQGDWKIDLRAPLKGYGIAPGSRTEHGAYQPLHVIPVSPIPASVVEAITAERDKAKGATKRQTPKDFDVDLAVDAILNAEPGERHDTTRSAVMRALWRDEPPETYERLREAFVKSTGGGSERENEFRGMVDGGKRKVEKEKNRVLSDFAFLTTNTSKPYFYIPNRTEMTAAGARATAKLSIKDWKMIVAGMKFKIIAEGTGNFPGRTDLLVEHDRVRWINT